MGYTGDKKREYDRKWLAARRAEWFLERYCVKCGSIDNLELDHIDPALKVHHAIWSWTATRRLEELAKCQALCKSCHLTKTIEFLTTKEHGRQMYEAHGCRCDVCRAAKQKNNARRYSSTARTRPL